MGYALLGASLLRSFHAVPARSAGGLVHALRRRVKPPSSDQRACCRFLTVIVCTGAELFTANCMFMTVAMVEGACGIVGLIKNWVMSYFGNLVRFQPKLSASAGRATVAQRRQLCDSVSESRSSMPVTWKGRAQHGHASCLGASARSAPLLSSSVRWRHHIRSSPHLHTCPCCCPEPCSMVDWLLAVQATV